MKTTQPGMPNRQSGSASVPASVRRKCRHFATAARNEYYRTPCTVGNYVQVAADLQRLSALVRKTGMSGTAYEITRSDTKVRGRGAQKRRSCPQWELPILSPPPDKPACPPRGAGLRTHEVTQRLLKATAYPASGRRESRQCCHARPFAEEDASLTGGEPVTDTRALETPVPGEGGEALFRLFLFSSRGPPSQKARRR